LAGPGPRAGQPFAYYETIAGGMGARPGAAGISGIHSHMTNSLNTPIEVLEHVYPVRVRRYSLRPGSGGRGRWRGGDGIIRELEFLTAAGASLLSDRRRIGPYGLAGGAAGKCGKNTLIRRGREQTLPSKISLPMEVGDVLRIESPGGGGWGAVRRPGKAQKKKR
ncbi:MAG TPA: hydantoinase B/oxoprolinase family protein, partial [Candidatus Acidoferrales bacterium]|nr:hydantoinase B/oxoprolinase family protein [Candidatus Acidoferrales bacterium]